ncbi:MAG: 16S rRNA (cytosine(1402)-N(4))-methyltransferase RsmH [Bacteroidaceae bacterium]|nr:16S rRNA (cytosine(1402)-N(4))-methyltransferase RsmH [Bacteroidaceae bacterium]
MAETYHIPVMLKESVEAMNIVPGGIYVDVTFGGGGHSREILSRMDETAHLYAFDQDADAEANIIDDKRFTFVRSNFRYLWNFMRYYDVPQVDAVLADLGVSSHHFDTEERGFSFRFDTVLDMRMNTREGKTAVDVLNDYDEEKLAQIFYFYGELKNGRQLAQAIARARRTKQIRTTGDLAEVTGRFFERDREKKEMAKMYQALRIEVNAEMEALKEMLNAATELLKPGGRLVVLTYHSIEDRLVKNMMKAGDMTGEVQQDMFGNVSSPYRIVEKVVTATDEEQQRNPRSRSAKLRVAEKR